MHLQLLMLLLQLCGGCLSSTSLPCGAAGQPSAAAAAALVAAAAAAWWLPHLSQLTIGRCRAYPLLLLLLQPLPQVSLQSDCGALQGPYSISQDPSGIHIRLSDRQNKGRVWFNHPPEGNAGPINRTAAAAPAATASASFTVIPL
jgi:hypothetical protein